jgi:deoxyribonuclease V
MNRFEDVLYAGVVVLSYPDLRVVETATAKSVTHFPYIPGLLSFRELPALQSCLKKLSTRVDVYMVDGQGIAHPRRLGIASHLGLLTSTPSIGCAKSVLYGKVEKGKLIDPKSREVLAALLQSKKNCKPLVISPGHLITLKESVEMVAGTLRGYRLPEPTRLAHKLVNDFRKGLSNKQEHGSRNK